MFINVNGPLDEWEPKSYVSSWLVNHKTAENTRTKKNVNKEPETREEKKSIWKILQIIIIIIKIPMYYYYIYMN